MQIVCATSIWCAITYYKNNEEGLGIVFGILALLFNPIFPIYLERSGWSIIDIIGSGVFIFSFSKDLPSD